MRSGAKKNSWLVTIAVAGGAVAFLLLVFLPTKKSIDELNAQIREKQNFIAAAGQLGQAIRDVDLELEQTKAYNELWRGRCPAGVDLARIYRGITQVSTQLGLNTTRFEPGAAISHERVQRTPVELGYVGSFESVCSLIEQITQMPEIVWIEHLRIQRSRENGEDISCEIKLVVFSDIAEVSGYVGLAESR